MAPSPTGSLHVGTARTALFNYLFARHHGGTFVLRIEDTDAQRNSVDALRTVFDGLRWLGLDWDEGPEPASLAIDAPGDAVAYATVAKSLTNRGAFGPYFQSLRTALYLEFADQLLASDAAYRCFCSQEQLDRDREEQKGRDIAAPRYAGRCRELSRDEQHVRISEGNPFVIRLRAPQTGTLGWDDLVKHRIEFECASQDDFPIVKSNGQPLYNFTVVVDDLSMRITHVLRGDDHISNTPKQLLIYRALGAAPPLFGHFPMINGPDGKKLSKRHGPEGVGEYGDRGVLPAAMFNFLALLGWSPGEGETQELFTREELIQRFDLAHAGKAAAVFNFDKLAWFNGQYLRALPLAELVTLCEPHLVASGLLNASPNVTERGYAETVVALERDRLRFPHEVVEVTRYFFTDEYEVDQKAAAKWLTNENLELLATLRDRLAQLESFMIAPVETTVRNFAEERGLPASRLIHPVRVALTGRTAGPGLFELMSVLGHTRCIHRLGRVLSSQCPAPN